MKPASPAQLTEFSFGTFDLQTQPYRLRQDGTDLEITPQQAQLLELMLQNAGTIVTRQKIRETLWPADVHVDFDRNINFCVTRLRAALGDDASSPRFIETVPRKGYRFVFPLSGGDPLTNVSPSRELSGRKRWLVLGGAGLAAAFGLMLVGLVTRGGAASAPSVASGETQVTHINKLYWNACGAAALEAGLPSEAKEALFRACYRIEGSEGSQLRQAAEAFEYVLTLKPEFEPAIAGLARVAYMFGDWEQADSRTRLALELNPQSTDALLTKAEIAFRHHFDWPEAERLFRHTMALDPNFLPARTGLASLLSAQGRFTESVRLSQETKESFPLSLHARSEFAEELYFAGQFNEAIEEAQRVVEVDMERPEAWLLIIHSHVALGQLDSALGEANRLLKDLGFEELADLDQLWEALSHQHVGNSSDPDQWSEKAFFTLAAGRLEEAWEFMKRACIERSGWSLPYFDVDPRFAPFRDEDELQNLENCLRLGFPHWPPRLRKAEQ
ncbi:MAG: winged helix-turn-helix domain-containing protein [Deltaproteobacteria bacterium]|nr:winged helix-turn-helix domain-containing protein [Deltaproteobacteria bacterium]